MQRSRIASRTTQIRLISERPTTPPPAKKKFWDWFSLKSVLTFGVAFTLGLYVLTYYELKGQTCIYEYTSVPEELKKKGFNEDLLARTINDIQYRISTYTDDIRSDLARPKINYAKSYNPSYVSSIQNMNIEGVPFKTLIHFTDKVLSFLGLDVNDNYVSIEFYTTPKNLHASVLFKGGRRDFTEKFDNDDPMIPLYNLCYGISITILEQSHPLRLAEYYYNIDESENCIKECMSVVATPKHSNEDKSKAYLFWGLALNATGYMTEKDSSNGIKFKFEKAAELNNENYDAKLVSLPFRSNDVISYKRSIKDLINTQPASYEYWGRLLTLDVDTISNCRSYVEKQDSVYLAMKKALKGNYPSDIPWRYGNLLIKCGDIDPAYYDSAILKFFDAVELELSYPDTDLRKLSYYYNSIAYSFEAKALTLSGNKNNACLKDFEHGESFIAQRFLKECYAYARQAISADSMNAFAWSTLGEFYGLKYMICRDEKDLEGFIAAEKKAFRYSFPTYDAYSFQMKEYMDTEPYCFIRKESPKRFEEIEREERFYVKGNYLRRLRIL